MNPFLGKFFFSSNNIPRILNVAEKPSIARKITELLSMNSFSKEFSQSKYNPIYKFHYDMSHLDPSFIDTIMYFTSVSGHINTLSYVNDYKKWDKVNPFDLFEAKIKKTLPNDKTFLVKNLQILSKNLEYLILWPDFDREGEAIAFEIIDICQKINPNLIIKRAHFSVVEQNEIIKALTNLQEPNKNIALAVDLRQELDLRLGSAFTVYQTVLLQKKHENLHYNLFSYGPCQIPTLGFVVDRYNKKKEFLPEKFWYLEGRSKIDNIDITLKWKRDNVLNRNEITEIYQQLFKSKTNLNSKISSISKKEKLKYKPYPMNTITLQKLSSDFLNFSSDLTMTIAEKLYSKGYISYPRTETNNFSNSINLFKIINMLSENKTLGQYAKDLASKNFLRPRDGHKDDKSHPPIYPAKPLNDLIEADYIEKEEIMLYELISRYFLACCSKDAIADENIVEILIENEIFIYEELEIRERNYLDIYPYDDWNKLKMMNESEILKKLLIPNQKLDTLSVEFLEGKTNPPTLLKESDLIQLMDSNEIGTDATIHEHIKKIQDRQYAIKKNGFFEPTPIGISLIHSYNQMNLKIAEPQLRANMEKQLKLVAEGKENKDKVLSENIQKYQEIMNSMKQQEENFGNLFLRKYNEIIENTKKRKYTRKVIKK